MNETWGFLVVIGFWGWILCTVGFIIKGFPFRDVFARTARWWGGAVIFFYCLWVVGMINA